MAHRKNKKQEEKKQKNMQLSQIMMAMLRTPKTTSPSAEANASATGVSASGASHHRPGGPGTGCGPRDPIPPSVISVNVNDPTITKADVGVGKFTVTVTFSEPMNTAATPVITFSPSVSTTLAFNNGSWNSTHTVYTAVYDVSDAGVLTANVAIGISGAVDVAGNDQQQYTATVKFGVDTTISGGGGGGTTAPANSVLPVISGTNIQGQTLTTTTGTWTGATPITYFYQWKSNGVNVGTNANSYNLATGDVGHTMVVQVTAINSIGSASATSNATGVIADPGGGTGGVVGRLDTVIYPELLYQTFYQEDLPPGPVSAWTSGGQKVKTAVQSDPTLYPLKLDNNSGVLFAQGTRQNLSWPAMGDTNVATRWWVAIARCPTELITGTNEVNVVTINLNAAGNSNRQPRVHFGANS